MLLMDRCVGLVPQVTYKFFECMICTVAGYWVVFTLAPYPYIF